MGSLPGVGGSQVSVKGLCMVWKPFTERYTSPLNVKKIKALFCVLYVANIFACAEGAEII